MTSLRLSKVLRPLKPRLDQLRTVAIGGDLLRLRGQGETEGERGGVKESDAGGEVMVGGVGGSVRRIASHLGHNQAGHGERLLD